MTYSISNKCAKNLCKWTVLVQLVIKNMVIYFFETQYSVQFSATIKCNSELHVFIVY